MRAVLAVHRVYPEITSTSKEIINHILSAVEEGADLVVFSEAAMTGLANKDDPAHDRSLGTPIPGPITAMLSEAARKHGIWLAIGLFETEEFKLYDSAILIDPGGEIVLKYRRIHGGWHGAHADPFIYCDGRSLEKVDTPLGSFAFLLCGDLFDYKLTIRMRDLNPDWLLFPMARSFESGENLQKRWETQELPEYIKSIRRIRCTTLMTNYYSPDSTYWQCCGGAMVASGKGRVICSFPLERTGILIADL